MTEYQPQACHRHEDFGVYQAKLKLAASAHMTKFEQSPERVKSFFQDMSVKYATWNVIFQLAGSILTRQIDTAFVLWYMHE